MKSPINRCSLLRTSVLLGLLISSTQAHSIRRGGQSNKLQPKEQEQRELRGRHRGGSKPSTGANSSNTDEPSSSSNIRCTLAVRDIQLENAASTEQIDCLPQNGQIFKTFKVNGLSSTFLSQHREEIIDGQISAQIPMTPQQNDPGFITNNVGNDDNSLFEEISMTLDESQLTIDPSQSRRLRRRLQEQTGVRRILAVRVKAADVANSFSLDHLRNEVFGIPTGAVVADEINLKTQMEACSHGDMEILPTTTDVSNGVYLSTVNVNAQGNSDSVVRNAVVEDLSKFNWMNGWDSVNTDVVDHIMICIPPGTSGGWIGYAWLDYYISVYNDVWCTYPSIQMHEVGHNLNLQHSGEIDAYDDQSGMMGYSYSSDEGPIMCFNSAKSWQLGWYKQKRMEFRPIESTTRTIQLYGITKYDSILNQGNGNEQVLIRILGGSDYYVGFNLAEGFNRGTQEGANTVMIVRKNSGATSTLLSKLSQSQSWSVSNFGSTGKTFILSVNTINVSDGYAEITLTGFVESNPPTKAPTNPPTNTPTNLPTNTPTNPPTNTPTNSPTTTAPTKLPTKAPTNSPTNPPTKVPTSTPTKVPTEAPTNPPTKVPTSTPTKAPTEAPTNPPTEPPTEPPTPSPTGGEPTKSPQPTNPPTPTPTNAPTQSPTMEPTVSPTTLSPTMEPTLSPTPAPTSSPTMEPTLSPTQAPTSSPTKSPTLSPTQTPTSSPTKSPTAEPTFSSVTEDLIQMRFDVAVGNCDETSTFSRNLQQVPMLSESTRLHIISSTAAYLEMSFTSLLSGTIYESASIHVSLSEISESESPSRRVLQESSGTLELQGEITFPAGSLTREEIESEQKRSIAELEDVERVINEDFNAGCVDVLSASASDPTSAPTAVPTAVPTATFTAVPTSTPTTKAPTPETCRQITNRRSCTQSDLKCKWKGGKKKRCINKRCRGRRCRNKRLLNNVNGDPALLEQQEWDDYDEEEDFEDDYDDDIFNFDEDDDDEDYDDEDYEFDIDEQ